MASRAQPSLLRATMKHGARRSGALIAGACCRRDDGAVLALLTITRRPALNTASGGPART